MDKRHQDARILALGAILVLAIGIITAWLFQDTGLFVMGLAIAAGFLAGAAALRKLHNLEISSGEKHGNSNYNIDGGRYAAINTDKRTRTT